jgi:protein-disulfide isomerase
VRFVFAPFPLGGNPESVAAAEAALAAEAQGKFTAMQDVLFAHEGAYDVDTLKKLAQKAGLDVVRFEREMTARAYKDAAAAIKQEGQDVGVLGTPAFFVNGRPFDFDPDLYTFADRFELELDRNAGSCQ